MLNRRIFLWGAGAAALIAASRWMDGSDVQAAASFEI